MYFYLFLCISEFLFYCSLLKFTVYRLPFTVHCLPFTVYRLPFTVYRVFLLYTLYFVYCSLRNTNYTNVRIYNVFLCISMYFCFFIVLCLLFIDVSLITQHDKKRLFIVIHSHSIVIQLFVVLLFNCFIVQLFHCFRSLYIILRIYELRICIR